MTAVQDFFIRRLSALADLGREDIDELVAATSRSRTIPARRDLVREGDPPGPLIVILDGWACRYKLLPNGLRQVLGFLLPGDTSDLHAHLLDQMDHSIQTVTPLRVAMIDRGQLDALLARRRGIAQAMQLAQLIDEGIMRAWITGMGRRSSVERVAHLMCELYVRARDVGLTEVPCFSLPLSQLLLADTLGMTAVHLNRVLRGLRVDGAMTFQRGSLAITDLPKLSRIGSFDPNYLHRQPRSEPHQLAPAPTWQMA